MVKTLSQLYLDARKALLAAEDMQTAAFYARNLVCHYTGRTAEQFLTQQNIYANEEACEGVDNGVKRLLNGEPLAYVLGQWEFYGVQLYVDQNVLIPRDDTCPVTELAIQFASRLEAPRVLDLCTGSGCIGLAVAKNVPQARVVLADISKEAMAVAKRNVIGNRLSSKVACVSADALSDPPGILGEFDLIVSNPPYITSEEMTQLPDSVKKFEPHLALHGGDDGLKFYRAIAKKYQKILKPGGGLCFEFGMGQGDDVCRILENNMYTILDRTSDYNNIERAVLAQYARKD